MTRMGTRCQWIARGLIFVALNVFLVGFYCFALAGKVEPLKHEPTRYVMLPLMVITSVVSVFLYPRLLRQISRLTRALTLYFGFVFISGLYGVYVWVLFPDGSPWTVLVALIGGHLYGLPLFLAVLVTQLLTGRLLFPETISDSH